MRAFGKEYSVVHRNGGQVVEDLRLAGDSPDPRRLFVLVEQGSYAEAIRRGEEALKSSSLDETSRDLLRVSIEVASCLLAVSNASRNLDRPTHTRAAERLQNDVRDILARTEKDLKAQL